MADAATARKLRGLVPCTARQIDVSRENTGQNVTLRDALTPNTDPLTCLASRNSLASRNQATTAPQGAWTVLMSPIARGHVNRL